jgi:aminopeptidase
MDDLTIDRLAELLVGFGANVQPGQAVEIGSDVGKQQLTRAIAKHCYLRGAAFVDVVYQDLLLRRERILHGPDEALGFEPPWTVRKARELGERRGAYIGLAGAVAPHAMDGLDPDRLRRDRPPGDDAHAEIFDRQLVNWSVGPCPTPDWAALAHPDLSPTDGVRRLWEQMVYVCRLDCDDPVGAWEERAREMERVCRSLTQARFDAVHLEGPGTDLTVGLLPSSRWIGLTDETCYGLVFRPNIPSEEVFTTPDPARVDGVATATRPVVMDGSVVRDLVVRFRAGRLESAEAATGIDAVLAKLDRDPGASRLGELALVDDSGRVGATGTTFFDTLLDENAASHIAVGSSYPSAVDDPADRKRANASASHLDFPVGSPKVMVTGIDGHGRRVPLLAGGCWQL